ncbi:putative Pseudopaline exporter CntI [Georgfuchsia toluolica]|uniref:Pseudopaline exporter CntI n=2 Tax=Georgfuchsia toluolica TaxID=424218 RepID=A0A916J4B9_9PROT|nr:putative Pseudopaline exporter CntI [Georgfuchsia toluolica]
MVAASFLFACMGVCVKLGSQVFSSGELVFARGAVATLLLGGYIMVRRLPLATPLWRSHLVRGCAGFVALVAYFYAIGMIPLAAAVTLSYTSPLFLAALLAFWMREPVRPMLYGALALGFVGIAMLLQPTLAREQWLGGVLGLVSGVVSSVAYLNVRYLGERGEPEWRTVFYFSLFSMLGGVPWLLAFGSVHTVDARGWGLLFGVGAFGASAQLCMTAAYKRGKTLATASLAYTTVVFSSLFGMLLWGEVLVPLAWSGIAIIVAGGVAAMALSRSAPVAPTEQD